MLTILLFGLLGIVIFVAIVVVVAYFLLKTALPLINTAKNIKYPSGKINIPPFVATPSGTTVMIDIVDENDNTRVLPSRDVKIEIIGGSDGLNSNIAGSFVSLGKTDASGQITIIVVGVSKGTDTLRVSLLQGKGEAIMPYEVIDQ